MKQDFNQTPWVVTFLPGDTLEEKLKKAAHVRPSAAQLAWMEKEYIAFLHFGPNTFSGRQWGTGTEDPSFYNPNSIDPNQWVEVSSQAGMKMIIPTLKHHDGFCQWFTETTDFSIENSPVKKDIAKIIQESCESNKIELGVYLSPWDMYQRNHGLWNTEEYNNYFLLQLKELLSRYGSIKEVWFDGACGDYEIWKSVPCYKPNEWYDFIESVQQDAVFRMYDPYYFASEEKWEKILSGKAELEWSGKAVRWVGNEEGKSRTDEWSVQPVFSREIAQNATYQNLGEESYYKQAAGAVWYPVEVNTTILNQWFWNSETSKVKSLNELIDVYYNSIGNNGVLLLNISPDRSGLVPEDQIQRLMQLKEFVQRTFSINLASKAIASASREASNHKAYHILDDNKMTFWTTDDDWDINNSSASIVFNLEECKTFDNVMIQEYIKEGQRVAKWSLEALIGDTWRELVCHKTIGYKNIKHFEMVTTKKVRLNIMRSWDNPMISNFGLYLTEMPEEVIKVNDLVQRELKPERSDPLNLHSGLEYLYSSGGIQSAALIKDTSIKAENIGITPTFNIQLAKACIGYAISYDGFIKISYDGIYKFRLESTDGSVLYLNERIFLNNDEPHEKKIVEGKIELKSGYYLIKLCYTSFRHEGLLNISWSGPGFEMKNIESDVLFH